MIKERIKLKTKDRDTLFKKEFSKLKIKVALNWFELVALFLVTFLGTLKLCFIVGISYLAISIIIAIIFATSIALVFSLFRKYQLKITRFDKEHIYKQISENLFEQSKCES